MEDAIARSVPRESTGDALGLAPKLLLQKVCQGLSGDRRGARNQTPLLFFSIFRSF